jgi:amino acid transporter
VALSYFACTLGSINAGARTIYSMAEDGYFLPSFGRAHPANATPHRAIALIGALSIAIPVALLFAGVSLYSVIDYLSQLAALGFIGSYFMVCLASPFFLKREGGLSGPRMAASAAALVLLCIVMVQSIYPVPPAPACFLPYVFAATLVAGVGASCWVRHAAGTLRPA